MITKTPPRPQLMRGFVNEAKGDVQVVQALLREVVRLTDGNEPIDRIWDEAMSLIHLAIDHTDSATKTLREAYEVGGES